MHYSKKLLTLFVAFAFCSVFIPGCSKSSDSQAIKTTYTHVDVQEAKELIDKDGSVLIDVRISGAYRYSHIPGAINLPIDDGIEAYTKQLKNKDQIIILYCDYGGVSKQAAELLAEKGYTNIYEFDGLEVWDGELEGESVD